MENQLEILRAPEQEGCQVRFIYGESLDFRLNVDVYHLLCVGTPRAMVITLLEAKSGPNHLSLLRCPNQSILGAVAVHNVDTAIFMGRAARVGVHFLHGPGQVLNSLVEQLPLDVCWGVIPVPIGDKRIEKVGLGLPREQQDRYD